MIPAPYICNLFFYSILYENKTAVPCPSILAARSVKKQDSARAGWQIRDRFTTLPLCWLVPGHTYPYVNSRAQ